MATPSSTADSPVLASDSAILGKLIGRMRRARSMKQEDAAERAGIARSSASRIEQGDDTVALGLVLRYIAAIAPGATLKELLNESPDLISDRRKQPEHRRFRSCG